MARPSGYSTSANIPKTLLLAAYFAPECQLDYENFVQEFLSLAKTAKIPADAIFKVKMRKMVSAFFLTKGKLAEVSSICQAQEIKRIVCALKLSTLQKRNLEDLTSCQILDRSDLILDIFRQAATSAEGRLQVKMAEVELLRTRLTGIGEQLGQQQAGAMARGPGETHKEYVKRFFKKVFAQAKKELEDLQKTRNVQRERRVGTNKPIFAIVGYTNAGKSSLLNALTGSQAVVEDKLFATLDTTTRELFVDLNLRVLISDTIGFISNIPHNLIAAFKSTLDELRYADYLLHVIDVANPAWLDQLGVVNRTLEEIDVIKPMVYVFNKSDQLTAAKVATLQRQIEFAGLKPYLFVSAKLKSNLSNLKQLLRDLVSENPKFDRKR